MDDRQPQLPVVHWGAGGILFGYRPFLCQKVVVMELLEEPKLSDRADQLLAFVLTLICVGLAAYSTSYVRSAVALAGEVADFRRNVTIPLVVILIARVVAAILQTRLVQSP